MKYISILFLYLLLIIKLGAQQINTNIRVNQIGYFTNSVKTAICVTDKPGIFHIKAKDSSTILYSGKYSDPEEWIYSKENAAVIDFSDFKSEGEFVIEIPGFGVSNPFCIGKNIFSDVFKASLKSYYFQRMSTPIEEKYAGKWHRAEGHPDTVVYVHKSAASVKKPEGTVISAPKGWYDAGDYNKYIVNSGISCYTLLAAYEHYPEIFNTLEINIPESGNGIPDILNELKYNIDWMLEMQDPDDGGVYHKLTNASFDGVIMPDEAVQPRYVVQKTTAAALNFAAVAAQASRIYKKFLPSFSEKCLQAAKSAYNWAIRNPQILYNQKRMNDLYDPDINTGGYEDENVEDEFIWAEAELYISSEDEIYLQKRNWKKIKEADTPSWNNVYFLTAYSLLKHNAQFSNPSDTEILKTALLSKADKLRNEYLNSPYKVTMGETAGDFTWGSNGVAANQGMLLLIAYSITKDSGYLTAAAGSLDYICGKNATGYCFITGFGTKSPMHIHHRQSEADSIAEPLPGFLAGGPQNLIPDQTESYVGKEPATKYLDVFPAYSTNEIAINWNAPLVFLFAGLQRLR
ncbi:MAG: cellulase [Ignavibacteria bacterium]|nr:cellulase [Ignavibacteria bacterium]